MIPHQLANPRGEYFSRECGKRIISFSLFGDNPTYSSGMIRNLGLAKHLYPSWSVVVFHDNQLAFEIEERLLQGGAKLFCLDLNIPMVAHRFLPIADPTVEHVIVRDADSSLSSREAHAVEAWIQSNAPIHVMRDHPHHIAPIMAGMWGCKGGAIEGFLDKLINYPFTGSYGEDQDFLANEIWAHYKESSLVHDSHGDETGNTHRFPTTRSENSFIGQRLGPDGKPIDDDHLHLKDI